ncbi:MAG: MFS transporter [bacterium]
MKELLHSKNFIFLCNGSLVSQFGDRITHMVLIALVGHFNPGSYFGFSKMAIFFTLPPILFSPIAGILADKYSKRSIMLFSDIARGLLIASLPLIIKFSGQNFTFVYLVIFLIFALCPFFNIARVSFIPQIVTYNKLLLSNSILNFIIRFATVFGMVLGGYLLDFVGWNNGFYIDAITYFISFIFIFLIPYNLEKILPSPKLKTFFLIKNIFSEIKESFILVLKTRVILLLMCTVVIFGLIVSSTYVIFIPKIQQELHKGTSGVGLTRGFMAIGMILGALLISIFHKRISKKYIFIISFFSIGILFSLTCYKISFFLINLIAIIGGMATSGILISQETYIQEKVSEKLRGKIFSIKEILLSLSSLCFALIIGWSAEKIKIEYILIILAIISILTSISFFYSKLFFKEK